MCSLIVKVKYCQYVKNFKTKSVSSKTLEILNGMPTCHTSDEENANSLICTFCKRTHIYKFI